MDLKPILYIWLFASDCPVYLGKLLHHYCELESEKGEVKNAVTKICISTCNTELCFLRILFVLYSIYWLVSLLISFFVLCCVWDRQGRRTVQFLCFEEPQFFKAGGVRVTLKDKKYRVSKKGFLDKTHFLLGIKTERFNFLLVRKYLRQCN